MTKYIYPAKITREELLHSDTATRRGILNVPRNDTVERNLVKLAYVLAEIRFRLKLCFKRECFIIITSGLRVDELNKILGSKSQVHVEGFAADFRVPGLTTQQVVSFIYEHCEDLDFDQVIDEFGRWIHIGIERPVTGQVRRQYLHAVKKNGRTRYSSPEYLKNFTSLRLVNHDKS
jgi:hypothetical protein